MRLNYLLELNSKRNPVLVVYALPTTILGPRDGPLELDEDTWFISLIMDVDMLLIGVIKSLPNVN